MGAKITNADYALRIKKKFPHITGKFVPEGIQVKCTIHKVTWKTTAPKLLQTNHGCPICAKKAQSVNISKGIIGELIIHVPYLSVVGRSKSKKAKSTWGRTYLLKIKCNRCNGSFCTPATRAKKLLGCELCDTTVSLRGGRSSICNNWLNELEGLYNIKIQGCNSKEKSLRIGYKVYRVDGYHKESCTVFEFLGDYWHGNPNSHPARVSAYDSTFDRFKALSKHYNIIYVWESDYKYTGLPLSGFLGRGPIQFLKPNR